MAFIRTKLAPLLLLATRTLAQTACSRQPTLPTGSGPVATPDTLEAFYSLPAINDAATNAPVPSGYTIAYTNLQTTSNAEGYQGYSLLDSYNVTECANRCDTNDRCTAFNIAFERAPTVDPTSDAECSNPPSTTLIKCVLWSGPLSTSNAVNNVQVRGNFTVAIAGSNAYNKVTPPALPNYVGPTNLGRRTFSRSVGTCSNGTRTGIRELLSYAPTDPFNVTRCATACDAEPQCQFFATCVLTRESGAQFGQICTFYRLPWGKEYATRRQMSFDGPLWDVSASFSYAKVGSEGMCPAAPPEASQ
ncbi:hypothetical protein CLAFUW4_13960 [Fulvia fulva]|uniref:Apple domain-containing protein n=1 Tax=Passalora fulva TaxID=5499 RepID=A0A9Q8PLW8_PASFU|nr:uncharacterized protein CLAFUR5_13800 [Fulvia fulva]KAK4610532.1 hypothetical protein CLAFUR4_13963 [Fulvia fulva]KAK4611106.1 hypothetical protein CLAFUR0_13967 [Fulvia fulva]UJO24787.1 hypothetical protein CLAFUR5_13800 [Fulvia fulva]WPV21890.1 hypothetical protein CLAFUW4_13960 [Fulvia fulva]WPV36739.1 hypothetical protein CLAFUW7_13968 [Fulvia fulva]